MTFFVKNILFKTFTAIFLVGAIVLTVLSFVDLPTGSINHHAEQSDYNLTFKKDNLTDIQYSQVSSTCKLDIMTPSKHDSLLPVIIYFHGGGWVGGEKEFYTDFCSRLVTKGFMVVNVDYRVIGEASFPAFLEDAVWAYNWVNRNITRYGGDSANIFLCGDSAGAHISALCANALTNPDFPSRYNIYTAPLKNIRALGLLCGIYDMTLFNDLDLAEDMVAALLDKKTLKQAKERADDLTIAGNISEEYPPCFLTTCYYDFVADQLKPMADSLKEYNIKHETLVYDETHTQLGHCYQIYYYPESKECIEKMTDFFLSCCV